MPTHARRARSPLSTIPMIHEQTVVIVRKPCQACGRLTAPQMLWRCRVLTPKEREVLRLLCSACHDRWLDGMG